MPHSIFQLPLSQHPRDVTHVRPDSATLNSPIDVALADGLRTRVCRLEWVDLRRHLHQHPVLKDDLVLERTVALSSLANSKI